MLKEDTRSLFLLGMPFTLGFEQQVPAPGQKLFGGITILVHDWGMGPACLSRVFDVFIRYCQLKSNWADFLPWAGNMNAEQSMSYAFVYGLNFVQIRLT